MLNFNESRFRTKVDKALVGVKRILDNAREPRYAADTNHTYDDKYGLAEFLTNAACAAQLNILEGLGLTEKQLRKLLGWAEKRSVTLRFTGEEKCVYDREETRKVESSTEYVTETKSSFFGNSKRTEKVVTKITEYFWKFNSSWELSAYKGNDPEEKIVLQTREGHFEIVTTVKTSPRPEVHKVPNQDLNITWLMNSIDAESLAFRFTIDRKEKSCHTPRQNAPINAALSQFRSISNWSSGVAGYFQNNLFPVQTGHSLNLGAINANDFFVPVLPLFEKGAKGAESGKGTAGLVKLVQSPASEGSVSSSSTALVPTSGGITSVLPVGDLNTFLWEQKRSFSEKFAEFDKSFPGRDSKDARLITYAEATVIALLRHAEDLNTCYSDGVDYIENMLYKQLIAAIGKEVTPIDFTAYMRFHNRKLFRSAYEPRPFCHSVRRPAHFPEGTLSIEATQHDGTMAEPILTNVRTLTQTNGGVPMRFPINAATNVVFGGNRYLHAWVSHQFAGNSGQSLNLVARARQFSSFILVVGRISSTEVFDPKAAMIIQNKDDLTIPLMLETIPAAKEFKERINSMSAEQQRFCKAYRSMQLESTLFGLVVLQIKPQLEKLLNLADDSLTKEIRLTQDLMELFIKYQVPSDLLSFDIKHRPNASAAERLAFVKECVKKMQDMVNDKKKTELKEKAQEAVYAYLDSDSASSSVSYSDNDEDEMEEEEDIAPIKRPSKMMMKKDSAPPKEMKKEKEKEKDMKKSSPMKKGAPAKSAAPAKPAPAQALRRNTTSNAPAEPPKSAPDANAEPQKPIDPQQQAELQAGADIASDDEVAVETVDFTAIPTELDAKCEELDEDAALRPTIINVGPVWTKKQQLALLADPTTVSMGATEQAAEKNRAFDLLDALSRSGSLPFDQAELHVVVAATHCFDTSIIATIIQQNVNPIEKVERSALLVASTIQDQTAELLIKADQVDRVKTYSPMLFAAAGVPAITN